MNKVVLLLSALFCVVCTARAASATGKELKPDNYNREKNNIYAYAKNTGAVSFVLNGTVVDENDESLPGATIRNKTNGKTAVTDTHGKFILEVESAQDSITITFVGYKTQTVQVGSSKTITIKLQPDLEGQKLNEVQVVGFGVQKKTTMVGAVASVSVKEMQKFSTPSLSNTIGGKIPGVITRQASGEPGYDAAAVYIRGIVSQSGDRRPLIIVDGVERELNNYWNTINIQEIESFSVLKDATATAVYGSRGANGVILITTKRGAVSAPKITFRSETAVMNAIRMPKYVDSYEYATLVNEAGKNVGLNPTYSPDDLQKYQDGSDPYLHPNVDWTNVVLRSQAMQTINNLGVTGGTESVKYYVNLGYTTQQGIYKEDKSVPYSTNALLKKYNFRTNIDVKLSKNISMELGLSAIIQNTNFPGQSAPAIFESLKLVTPLSMPLINPNGSIPANNGDLVLNPFSRSTQTGYTKQFYNTLVSNLGFKWDLSSITEGLSVRALSAFDVVDITQNIRSRTPATFKYSKDPAGNDVYQPMALEQKLSLRNAYETYRTIYIETSANYDRVFAKKHTVSGMFLARRREFVNIGELNSRLNLPERSQGIVTRLTYNYDNRYVMEANAAYNGSEQFPKGKQYGFFPSIGGAWLISNEKFWKESKVISLFKLRGSYGLVGNDRLAYPVTEASRFLFQTIVTQGGAGYPYGIDMNNGKGGIIESRFGTEDVTWELAKKANIGFNLEMYDGKINLTADFFRERREDQLLRRQSLPQYSGYAGSAPYGNVGLSISKGFEAGLQLRNTTKGGFYYAFNGTFSYAKSQILENDLPRPLYDYQELRGSVIGANLGYEALGFFQSQAEIDASPSQKPLMSIIRPGDIKYKDQNGDGLINDNDRVIIGKNGTEPQIMYGFGTTFAYKGFDMSIYFTGAAKRDFFFNARNFSMWPFQGALGNYNVNQEYYDHRWIPGQDNSKAIYPAIIPGSTNNYTISTTWMRSGSYLKIKNAEVGYTLPRNVTKRIGISNARVFAQGTNLAIWDEIKIVDPESDFGTGGYPTTRNFNFGLEVSF